MNKIRITNIRAEKLELKFGHMLRDDAGILLHDLHNRAHLHEQGAINRLVVQLSVAGCRLL